MHKPSPVLLTVHYLLARDVLFTTLQWLYCSLLFGPITFANQIHQNFMNHKIMWHFISTQDTLDGYLAVHWQTICQIDINPHFMFFNHIQCSDSVEEITEIFRNVSKILCQQALCVNTILSVSNYRWMHYMHWSRMRFRLSYPNEYNYIEKDDALNFRTSDWDS